MAETAQFKEKRRVFAKVLKNFAKWMSLVESEGLFTITVEGEEMHYMDVLNSFEVVPTRQRQAVWLMCIEDRSEQDVAKIMGFTSWPTPVQQYKNLGLSRMMRFLNASSEDRATMVRSSARYNKPKPVVEKND